MCTTQPIESEQIVQTTIRQRCETESTLVDVRRTRLVMSQVGDEVSDMCAKIQDQNAAVAAESL